MVVEVLTREDVKDFVTNGDLAQRFEKNNTDLLTRFGGSVRAIVREEVRAIVREEVRAVVREEVRAVVREEVRAVVREEVRVVVQQETLAIVRKEIELNNVKLADLIGKVVEQKLKDAHIVMG